MRRRDSRTEIHGAFTTFDVAGWQLTDEEIEQRIGPAMSRAIDRIESDVDYIVLIAETTARLLAKWERSGGPHESPLQRRRRKLGPEIVDLIDALRAKGATAAQIADALNDAGHRTLKGLPWNRGTVGDFVIPTPST